MPIHRHFFLCSDLNSSRASGDVCSSRPSSDVCSCCSSSYLCSASAYRSDNCDLYSDDHRWFTSLACFRRLRYGQGLAGTLLLSLSPRSCRTLVPASQLNARLAHFWVSGVAPLARSRSRLATLKAIGPLTAPYSVPLWSLVRLPLICGLATLTPCTVFAALLPVPRPCRIPTGRLVRF